MEDFRSKSCGDGRMEMERYSGYTKPNNPSGLQDLRCYSASYESSSSYAQAPPQTQTQMEVAKDMKFKKGKSTNGFSSKSWSFNDPELKRKKRVASYKVYTVEGKVKGSIRKGFRWFNKLFM